MEEAEVPLEKVQEDIEKAAHGHSEGGGHGGGHIGWLMWSALLSAVLAVLAAVASLNAGHHANEAMMEQIKASDAWSHYQAKSIKATVLETRVQLLEAMGRAVPEESKKKLENYGEDQENLQEQATEKEAESVRHFQRHEIFARSVTLFQIAIAVTAIAVLARKRRFLIVSILFGLAASGFLVLGLFFPPN